LRTLRIGSPELMEPLSWPRTARVCI